DARLIHTHRDPVTAVASVASLSSVLHRVFSRRREATLFGHEVTTRWTDGLERSLELRRSGRIAPERIVDVHYGDLVQDPMAIVRRIYSQFAMPFTAEAERRMRALLANSHQSQPGRHQYALDSFGLDAEDLAVRFKAYSDYFGVPSEVPAQRQALQ